MKTISSIFDQCPDALQNRQTSREQETRLRQGRSNAIQFLGLAKKPSGKVAGRLEEQGYQPEEILHILRELKEDGYLDDHALAMKTLRQRTGRKAESKAALAQRMKLAGISTEAIDEVLKQAPDDQDSARDLLHARFPELMSTYPDLSPSEKRKHKLKIARFLAGRGFSQDVVTRVLSDNLTDIMDDTYI